MPGDPQSALSTSNGRNYSRPNITIYCTSILLLAFYIFLTVSHSFEHAIQMHLLADGNNRVRSSALKMLTACLQPLQRLPRSDANVFGEYILPAISIVSIITISILLMPHHISLKWGYSHYDNQPL